MNYIGHTGSAPMKVNPVPIGGMDEAMKDRQIALLRAEIRRLLEILAILRCPPRVDAVLDRAEAGPDFNQERNAHADTIAAEYDSEREQNLECLSQSANCRRRNPAAVSCCALYEQYAAQQTVSKEK